MTKKTIELTYDRAVELLDRAVAEKGEEYVYEIPYSPGECAYFHDERPGCIVGHVLAYAGLERDDLRGRESLTFPGALRGDLNVMAGPDSLAEYGVLSADDRTVTLLAEAQSKQDEGTPWYDAVEVAKGLGA